MTEQPKAKGGEHGGKARIEGFRENPSIPAITLAQAGIDKNLAHRAVCLTKSAAQTAGCPFVACDQHDVKAPLRNPSPPWPQHGRCPA